MKLTRQSKSSSTHSFSCHAGLRTNGARMLHVLAYCLIAFGVGALLVVDRLGIGARAPDGKQRRGENQKNCFPSAQFSPPAASGFLCPPFFPPLFSPRPNPSFCAAT